MIYFETTLKMLLVDPSVTAIGVSVLNGVVCTYNSFEQFFF